MTAVDRRSLPSVLPEGAFHFPRIHTTRLANGLAVRAVVHRAVPVVSAVLLVPGGFAADPASKPGLAALTADLLDEGSDGLDALAVADRITRIGGDLDVDLTPDATMVSLTLLARFLDSGLDLLAGIATRPSMADDDIERIRRLRLDRLRQLRDHAPATAERLFARALYGAHPYGHIGLGDEASLAAMSPADIRTCHARAFTPAAATLVVAGDADVDALIEAADRAFGGWRSDATGADVAAATAPPAPEGPRLVLGPRPGAQQSELRIGHTTVSRATPDYHALLVLNAVLGGQFVSRLNMNLRQDKGFTYGARTGFDLRRGPGCFSAQASVQSDATAAAAAEMIREIADIRAERPPSDEELALARASLTLGYPRGFETVQQVAHGAASLALFELPDTYFEDFVPTIRAVTRADVTRVASTHLDPSRLVGVAVGDVAHMGAVDDLGLGAGTIVPVPQPASEG